MIDRYEALLDLRNFPLEDKRTALLQAGSTSEFHLIKSEIMDQLSADKNDESRNFIINCLTDTNVFVRRAAINAMQEHHLEGVLELEKVLSDISYSNQELALRKLATLNPDRLPAYLSLAHSGNEKAFELLTNFSGNQYEFRTRINAIKALASLNKINEAIAENLIAAAFHWNFRLSPVALEALQEFYASENNRMLISDQLKKSNLTREQQVELKQKLKTEHLTH
jgi:HEAT repeat protein